MDSDSGDLLLKIVISGTSMVPGASQTELTPAGDFPNPLTKGFDAGSIIEIDSFTLRCGTSGLEPGAKPPPPIHQSGTPTQQTADDDKKEQSIGALARKGGYQQWRAGKDVKYPLDIQPITFEHPADISSQKLIQNCISCTPFESASIVKRKPVGTAAAGEVYMRLDFQGVLIIKVEWADEGDYIKETVSFIARGITVSYLPQTSSGGLGAPVQGFWSMVPGMKAQTYS